QGGAAQLRHSLRPRLGQTGAARSMMLLGIALAIELVSIPGVVAPVRLKADDGRVRLKADTTYDGAERAIPVVAGFSRPVAQTHVAPAQSTSAIVASIEAQGGDVVRDAKGEIVEVSLARTWATDADVERLAALRTVKRLDLSLTYVSDRGMERLKALDRL